MVSVQISSKRHPHSAETPSDETSLPSSASILDNTWLSQAKKEIIWIE